jgi:uncharacterized lipoprotein YmbA
MTNMFPPRFLACTAALIFLSFAGCATTGPVKFYTLSSAGSAVDKQKRQNDDTLSIEVGPVEIPDYLDRPYLVTRSGRNELMISDFHRWAGPLQDEISRALAEDLSARLSTDYVYIYPWTQPPRVNYHVRVKVIRFEGTRGKRIELKAYWSIYGERETELLVKNSFQLYEDTGGNSYNEVVAAMSRAVGKLSGEIAGAIRSLSGM